jgi:hypothetical protein
MESENKERKERLEEKIDLEKKEIKAIEEIEKIEKEELAGMNGSWRRSTRKSIRLSISSLMVNRTNGTKKRSI